MLLSDSGNPLVWYTRNSSSILGSSTKFLFRILFVTETTYKSKFSWASILVVWISHWHWEGSGSIPGMPTKRYAKLRWCKTWAWAINAHGVCGKTPMLRGRLPWSFSRGSIPESVIHIVYGTEKHRGYAFAWKAKGRGNLTEFRLLLVPPYWKTKRRDIM